ncbi:MAG: glycosyltransferase [Deltaproteobacteria bacterium]|nr:glycosyltransferase [Deltaproteobacteria bacterium]
MQPRRFSEKVWSRQLHDRDPRLTLISDNLRVRDYVAGKGGGGYLIPLLWNGASPAEIPFDDLPLEFVIKTNHGCGFNIIVKDKSQLDREKIKRRLKKWIDTNYCKDTCLGIAWGYKNIKPHIIIESFLKENEKAPVDFKFYCFAGRVEFLTMHFDRFKEHKTRSFNRNFKPHEFRYGFDVWSGEVQRPLNFEAMVQLAESLAEEFDFMRVDLYNVGGRIYFSELTPYPGGVSLKFKPDSYDYFLSEKWKWK